MHGPIAQTVAAAAAATTTTTTTTTPTTTPTTTHPPPTTPLTTPTTTTPTPTPPTPTPTTRWAYAWVNSPNYGCYLLLTTLCLLSNILTTFAISCCSMFVKQLFFQLSHLLSSPLFCQ